MYIQIFIGKNCSVLIIIEMYRSAPDDDDDDMATSNAISINSFDYFFYYVVNKFVDHKHITHILNLTLQITQNIKRNYFPNAFFFLNLLTEIKV